MDVNRTFALILAMAVGFSLGWLAKPTTYQINDDVVSPDLSKEDHNDTAPSPAPAAGTSKAIELDAKPAHETIQALQAQIEQLTKNDLYSDKKWTIEELMESLNGNDPSKIFNSNIFEYASSNPELISQLLDSYFDIETEEGISSAREILRMANRRNGFRVEKQIIDRLKLGQNQSQWLATLADFGANTVEGLSFLTERLDYQFQGEEIGNAIVAVNRGSDRLFNKIPRETREQFTQHLAKQVHSEDTVTRAAAISSLAAYPIADSENVIINALTDSNRVVQFSALQTLMRGEFQSDSIRDSLLNIIRDENQDLALRATTAQTLRRYNLEGQDYDDLYEFNQRLENRRQESRPAQLLDQ